MSDAVATAAPEPDEQPCAAVSGDAVTLSAGITARIELQNGQIYVPPAPAPAKPVETAEERAVKEAKFKAWLGEMLTPGPDNSAQGMGDLVPSGKCNGVIFLGEGKKTIELDTGKIDVQDVPTLEREAYRYLKPMSAIWRALHPGKIGITRPHDVPALFTKEMLDAQQATRRPLDWMFHRSEENDAGFHGIVPTHSQHVTHWKIFRVQEFIWVLLYV